MIRRRNIILGVIVALGLLMLLNFTGLLPVFTFLGFRVVEPEYTASNYGEQTTAIFEEWKLVINDWEESPTQLNAGICHQHMQDLITSWDSITPLEKLKDYHLWMRKAMEYEAEAFRIMADTPSYKLADVRAITVQLWVLKDEALLEAEATIPEPELDEISEPLKYRILDSFTTEAVKDVRNHAAMRGYDLPYEIVEWSNCALYVVVQNLDDVPGKFEVRYNLSTADKNAAERQQWLVQRTPEEYAELDREYYEGSIELYLESGEVGVAICPPDGIYIALDRVPFSHEHTIIPETKTVTIQQ